MVRVAPLDRARLKAALRPGTVVAAAWVLGLCLAEVLGRLSPHDVMDSVLVLGIVALSLFTWRQHKQRPLEQVEELVGVLTKVGEWIAALPPDSGIDLRGEPRLPRRVPGFFLGLVAVVACFAWAAFALRLALPTSLREATRSLSAAVWLLGLTGLWGALLAGTLIMFVVPVALLGDALENAGRGVRSNRRWIEAGAVGLFLGIVLCGAAFAPNWVPLVLIGATIAFACLLAVSPFCPELTILWRPKSGGPAAGMPWTIFAVTNLLVFGGLISGLFLLACGDRLVGPGSEETAVTAFLGLVFGWTGSVSFLVLMASVPLSVHAGNFRNPSRPNPARVLIEGASEPVQDKLQAALEAVGLQLVRDPAERRSTDVSLRYAPDEPREPVRWQSRWPLTVGEDDFDSPELVERLSRRDQILRRRQLLKGLERVFKLAARREYERGSGFWVGPHHWFITRLGRDVDEDDAWFGGPTFHPHVPLAARAHLFEILAGCEIDLIFVEDGVGFRRLKRVFALLFEYHDIFGGELRAEERNFSGVPGVRVLIHEHDIGVQYPYSTYPEPDYEDLGRARILHVFRDRGEDEELSADPEVPDYKPEPVLL